MKTLLLLLLSNVVIAQNIIFNQGFEVRGTGTPMDNWGFVGGVYSTDISKVGVYSLKVGSPDITSQVTFNTVDISQYTNCTLQISHSVLQGVLGESGLDELEGIAFQVSLDGGNWITVSKVSGLNNYYYSFNDSVAGLSPTFNSCRLYKTPNPLNYIIPENTNSISVRVMSIKSQDCRGFNYDVNNGISNSFDRFDEAFYLDDVRILGESITFPIELGIFDSEKKGESIQLNWITYSEINSIGFSIERSSDGIYFEEIGWVHSNNFENQKMSYDFVDKYPYHGDNYYRLKMVDSDMTFEYSKTIHNLIDKSISLNVYPNPIAPGETLNINQKVDNLIIVDLNGKVISYTKEVPNDAKPGTYIVKLNINNQLITKKITIK
jgi:hypothetical protein